MIRRQRISIKTMMIIITCICLISIVFTWELKGNPNSIEKSIAYVVIPLQNGVNSISDWFKERIDFFSNIGHMEALNKELLQEVDQLKYENQILQQNQIELARLRELYELDTRYADYPKIGAQVVSKDPGNWYDNFVINKGANDGLKEEMVVLSGNGLVGYITQVGPNYSKVKTIINDSSKVSASNQRTADICLVSGDKTLLSDKAYCRVEKISDDAKIIIGDTLVTSHLGGRYPPGIMIGTIRETEDDPHLMTKRAVLETAVDFKHIEEVLVINYIWQVDIEAE